MKSITISVTIEALRALLKNVARPVTDEATNGPAPTPAPGVAKTPIVVVVVVIAATVIVIVVVAETVTTKTISTAKTTPVVTNPATLETPSRRRVRTSVSSTATTTGTTRNQGQSLGNPTDCSRTAQPRKLVKNYRRNAGAMTDYVGLDPRIEGFESYTQSRSDLPFIDRDG